MVPSEEYSINPITLVNNMISDCKRIAYKDDNYNIMENSKSTDMDNLILEKMVKV